MSNYQGFNGWRRHSSGYQQNNGFGAAGLVFTIDTPSQRVGQQPTFTIYGATPGSTIRWSSYLNGQPTSEYETSYGHVVDANGTWQSKASAWQTDQVGQWLKEIEIVEPNGNRQRAVVGFTVAPAATDVSNALPTDTGSSFRIGNLEIPKPLFYIGAGLLAYNLLTRKGR